MSLNNIIIRLGEEITKLSQRFESLKQENRSLRNRNLQLENSLKDMEGVDDSKLGSFLKQIQNMNQEESRVEVSNENNISANDSKDDHLL